MTLRFKIDAEMQTALNDYLHKRLVGIGFRGAEILPYEDHDGMSALQVLLKFDLVDEPIDSGFAAGLAADINELLDRHGESRFAYPKFEFDERQKIKAA